MSSRATVVGRQPTVAAISDPRRALRSNVASVAVRDHGLDLGHEERQRGLVPGEDVYGPALAVNPERHLGANVPARIPEQAGHQLDEAGVVLVQQSIKSLALPAQANVDTSPESSGNPRKHLEREATAEASFDPRNDRLADAGGRAEVDLALAAAHAQCPDASTEADHVHTFDRGAARSSGAYSGDRACPDPIEFPLG